MNAELLAALDTEDLEAAATRIKAFAVPGVGAKIGLELFTAHGPEAVRRVGEVVGRQNIFLDLKYLDIPNTVRGAAGAATALGVGLFDLHARSSIAMMEAALEGATESAKTLDIPRPLILAVTILTSEDVEVLRSIGYFGGRDSLVVHDLVMLLADNAKKAGLDGVVASALDTEGLRAEFGPEFKILNAGLRFPGGETHDQKRVASPESAARDGANFYVMGRDLKDRISVKRALDDIARGKKE